MNRMRRGSRASGRHADSRARSAPRRAPAERASRPAPGPRRTRAAPRRRPAPRWARCGSARRRSAAPSTPPPPRPRCARAGGSSAGAAPSAARDRVRQGVRGVGVEGAHQRQIRRSAAQRVPADEGRDRLVDVRHVVAARCAAPGAASARPPASAPGWRRRRWPGDPTVRPSETKSSGVWCTCGRAPRCIRRDSASSGSKGARIRGSCPAAASSAASASMCRVTPPG